MRNRVTLTNMVTGLALQICLIVSGLILPRLILRCFGSETNGLDAIDPAQMDDREKQRLNDFHREVIEKVAPLLTEEEAAWLREATRPI